MPDPSAAGVATPRFGTFDGILEGRTRDPAAMRAVAATIDDLGLASTRLSFEGTRYSLLLDDAVIDGARLTEEHRREFGAKLQGLIDLSDDPSSVESTLRCVLVYDDEVTEILMVPIGGTLRAVGRTRPVTKDDQERAAATTRSPSFWRRRSTLLALLLLLGVASIGMWDAVLNRWLLRDAASVAVDTGPFQDLIRVTLSDERPGYRVRIERGDAYPASPRDADALTVAADSLERRAAVLRVAEGGAAHLRFSDDEGGPAGQVSLSLSRLLSGESVEVHTTVTADPATLALRLAP